VRALGAALLSVAVLWCESLAALLALLSWFASCWQSRWRGHLLAQLFAVVLSGGCG